MAGAGVVGVAVGNHGFVHRLRWIDMEPAEPAAQAGGRRQLFEGAAEIQAHIIARRLLAASN